MSLWSWLFKEHVASQIRREALNRLKYPPRRSLADTVEEGGSGNPQAWRTSAQTRNAVRHSSWRPWT